MQGSEGRKGKKKQQHRLGESHTLFSPPEFDTPSNSDMSPIYGNMNLSNSIINKDNIYKRACQTPSGLSSLL